MQPRLLLDTHVLVRWLVESKRLSREQARVLEAAVKRTEPLAFSAISLLEIAMLEGERRIILKASLREFFEYLQGNPVFRMLPLCYEAAWDVASLGTLRDPADRTIVATARVHRLQLVTSDERIIGSNLVPTIS